MTRPANDNRATRSRAKQDEASQKRRLVEGRCPIHGLSMGQVGVWERGIEVACPRGDCGFQVQLDLLKTGEWPW